MNFGNTQVCCSNMVGTIILNCICSFLSHLKKKKRIKLFYKKAEFCAM